MNVRFSPPHLQHLLNADTFVRTASELMAPEIAGEFRVLQPYPQSNIRLVLIVSGREPISVEVPAGWLDENVAAEQIRQSLSNLLQLLPSHRN